ncbi:MAG TPA: S-layer homology domain-containing protein [Syntrophomonadaceae bacterium]|nr:S-layer homology domain-containing protein [Syntrophomonadaceae bacterium]
MKRKFYKPISFLTLIFFVFTMIFSLSMPAYANANPYADVKSGDWHYQYVVKMNLRDVVAGYPDGTFKPDHAVTQLEAVLMAVRNMEPGAKLVNIDTSRSLPFPVPEWAERQAKKELLFAIDAGLIVTSENAFVADNLANRAWMTRLMVRMIDKGADAALNASEPSPFTDAHDAPTWAKGYINTAIKYDLISGFPDGSFKPNEIVTRAQTAVLLGRSESYLDLSHTNKGKILNSSSSSVNITVNGITSSYAVTSDSIIYDGNNKPTSAGNLIAGQEVLLVAANYNIKYLEVLTESKAPPATATITGTLIKVLAEQSVIIVKDEEGNIHTKHLATGVQCLDSNGKIYPLEQVPVNTEVAISLDAQGFVNSFILQTLSGQIKDSGVIYEIDSNNNLLILKSQDTFSTFQYSDLVEIEIEKVRFATIDDLQAGDEVKIQTDHNVVNKITLLKSKQELTLSGIVVMNNKEVLVIKKEDGLFETFEVAPNPKLEIAGLDIASITDVLVDDNVTLDVEDGVIVGIKVTNRSYEDKLKGNIVAIDKDMTTLVIETSNEKLHTFEISKYFDYDIGEGKNSGTITRGMKVEIELLDNKVIYLTTKNTVEGIVIAINLDRNLLSLKTDEGSMTYQVDKNVDIYMEKDVRAKFKDLDRNDLVEVKTNKDNIITEIYVENTFVYEVTSSGSDYIRVKDQKDKSRYVEDDDKPEIIIPGVSRPSMADFKAGDVVRVTYKGYEVEKIELIPATAGEVLSVNWTDRTMTIAGFDGKITKVRIASDLTISKNDKSYNNISVLDIGDRVKVRETADRETHIEIMNKLRTQYVDTEQNNSKLYITRNQGYSYVIYDIASPIYIHKDNQSYTFNNLRENDWVNIYYIDKVVYEIEKE